MSRKNRFFTASRQTQSPFGNPPQPVSAAVPDGTMIEPMLQAEVSPPAGETLSVSATGIGTSQFAMPSAAALAGTFTELETTDYDAITVGDILGDAMKKTGKVTPKENLPKLSLHELYRFSIKITDCCGMHILSGIQAQRGRDPMRVILGIENTYITQRGQYVLYTTENEKYHRDWHQQCRAFIAANTAINKEEAYRQYVGTNPYIPPVNPAATLGQKVPGMIVFTWNSVAYDQNMQELVAFIVKHGLGSGVFSGKVVNPNSHNEIESMTWLINKHNYDNFIAKHYPREAK